MVQQPGDEDIKVIKVERNLFCKDPKQDFNALASPTTPLQFEARQGQFYPPALFDDAARIQNSIQLQLLNYLRSFGAQPNNLYSQHQGMGIPSEYLAPGAVEHPTIALLQQRFRRLERDKEMRQAKQLHRGYSSQGQVPSEAGKFPSSSTCSSPHSPGSCNLQLSLPIKCSEHPHSSHLSGSYLGRNDAWSYSAPSQQMSSPSRRREQPGFSLFRDHDNLEVELRNPASFPLNFPAEPNELEVHSSRNNNKLLSLLPASNPSSSNFPVQQHPRNPNHSSPSCSTVHQYNNGHSETQFFLRNWKTAVGRESIPVVADDDVDTSLHL